MLSIYTSAQPLHLASKIFGFLIFSIENKSFTVTIKNSDYFFIICNIVVNLLIFCVYWFQFLGENTIDSNVISKGIPIVTFMQYSISTFVMILSFIRRKNFVVILKMFNEIDLILREEFGVKFNYCKERQIVRNIIISLINGFITIILFCGIVEVFKTKKINPKDEIYLFWCLSTTSLVLINFSFIAFAIKMRFEKVNEVLRSLQPNFINFITLKPQIFLAKIKNLSKVHFHITELITEINKNFSIGILLILPPIFAWFCVFLLMILKVQWIIFKTFYVLMIIKMLVVAMLDVLLLISIYCANKAKCEGIETAKILFMMKNENNFDENVEKKISAFIDQIKFMSTKFSCGLFALDWKLIFKFFSAAIMYFIIMVQFDNLSTSNGTNQKFENFTNFTGN
ncbi:hypothetical protein PVAND_014489 [Polypedilum vanderplanki]|uniref:Gustatory receptor n=1 Tax=Polypedilum vanderplanki TaxID=319348 RepID=A0A9J6BA16_POLVA|nr:hypothetical protein PVAND_014489 [Polypedilum vanderplanki]